MNGQDVKMIGNGLSIMVGWGRLAEEAYYESKVISLNAACHVMHCCMHSADLIYFAMLAVYISQKASLSLSLFLYPFI